MYKRQVFIPSSINTATLIIPQIAANGVKAQILAGDTWENASIISKDAVGVKLSTFFDETDKTNPVAVSYTHLDVYKRQQVALLCSCLKRISILRLSQE